MTLVPQCPTLTTDRLTLRAPQESDIAAVAAFFADPVRSVGFGGPEDEHTAWRWFASMIGHWHLRGYGFWFADLHDGTPVGMTGLWNPSGWPEPELGWVLYANAEGKGYAVEMAKAVRHHAYTTMGWTTLTSNIVPDNDKSKAVARRLGAKMERVYENPAMGTDELWRHPAPHEVAA
ncbi:GNAT family N-acetyltransferase [Yoonia sp. 208BN28-4]|uniref:GNAT family N-acetyltransferase n=1 Tax=Yoonia sp. 208BN28-4 TaxID=3126505 RepID=UPI003097D71D